MGYGFDSSAQIKEKAFPFELPNGVRRHSAYPRDALYRVHEPIVVRDHTEVKPEQLGVSAQLQEGIRIGYLPGEHAPSCHLASPSRIASGDARYSFSSLGTSP